MAKGQPERREKPCAYCGRPFTDRKRWSARGQWDAVLYCSHGCRAKAASERRQA